MNQLTETILYEKNDIKITSLRAIFGAKTYAISNITSVEGKRIDANSCFPIGLIMAGITLLAFGTMRAMDGKFTMLLYAFLLLIPGYMIFRNLKPSFAVNLTTASGEVKAYTSPSWEAIREIVEALNNAIIQKG